EPHTAGAGPAQLPKPPLPLDRASQHGPSPWTADGQFSIIAFDPRRQTPTESRMAVHVLDWHQTPPATCQGGAVSTGNFDGVHRGHAALMAELRRQAESVSGLAVALTFDPHPLKLLRPEQFQP